MTLSTQDASKTDTPLPPWPVQVVMTPEVVAALREPFPDEHKGKLPKITCGKCRGTQRNPNPRKVCDDHTKRRCPQCRNTITTEHMHLDYVGHAEVTDRLIAVDPMWTWEPLAFDSDGLPKFDQHGGMWIRLMVAGKPMLGYGDAGSKSGPDAVKEVIGDAIRNAAMRLGVALDLWGATFKAAEADAEARVRESAPDVPDEDWENATPVYGRGTPPGEMPQVPVGPARPVATGPTPSAYDRTLYPRGVDAVTAAATFGDLDKLAELTVALDTAGKITDTEARRLRMKIADRRDILTAALAGRQVTAADEPPDGAGQVPVETSDTATTEN